MTRPIMVICTQCGRVMPELTKECDHYRRRVYADSVRVVGSTIEVDNVEPVIRATRGRA